MTKFGNNAQKLNNLRPRLKILSKFCLRAKKAGHPALNGCTSLPCISVTVTLPIVYIREFFPSY